MNLKIKFEPRDLWVGIFWEKAGRSTTLETDVQHYRIYVCIVPCLPIILTVSKPLSRPAAEHQ